MIIKPNHQTSIAVGGKGRYLIVRSTSAPVFISADGLRPQRLQTGDRINVEQFNQMFVEHRQTSDVNFDYQISDLEHKPAATDDIVIRRIVEPIQFEAHVSVNDGLKVQEITPSLMTALDDVTLPPGQSVRLTAGGFRQVTVQVISDELTPVRIGGGTVSATRGLLVLGSKSAIGSLSVDFSGAVHAYNASDKTAKLTIVGVK
ncbi:hypothetical protein [Vibrio quintilis]|uniref:Uncharacterized protein n=1 Tax=Vibrio quintilis TaxID=1117707 RepID=A0A1M7YPE8_9VIBR|nr:hypothetical protein [Vibrio quintilis]SHO54479.1 hypothetical protein VQ7734_00193 [Vibrio quintilis]